MQEALDSFGGGLGNILGGATSSKGPYGAHGVMALKWRLRESKELASGVLAALGRWEAWSQMQW